MSDQWNGPVGPSEKRQAPDADGLTFKARATEVLTEMNDGMPLAVSLSPEQHYQKAESRLALAETIDQQLRTLKDSPFSAENAFTRHLEIAETHRRMAETGLALRSTASPSTQESQSSNMLEVDEIPERKYSSFVVSTRREEIGDGEAWRIHVEHPRWGAPVRMHRDPGPCHARPFSQGTIGGIQLCSANGTILAERYWAIDSPVWVFGRDGG